MERFEPGKKYGKWTTQKIVRIPTTYGRRTFWEVKCDCGTIASVRSTDLVRGKTTQCKVCRGTDTKDLTGLKFSDWTVIREGTKKNGKTHWICKCKCGIEENVCSASLTKGVSTRCLYCYQKTMEKVYDENPRTEILVIW